MPEFRSRPDGSKYPITPKKGGIAAAAVVLTGVVAFGAGGLGGAGAGGTATDSAAGQSLRTENGKREARKGQTTQAWARIGWKQLQHKAEHALDCAVNSYGQVREFFLRNPCKSLERDLLAVADDKGNTVVVSIAWVRMGSADAAERLKDLADTDGTGSIAPLGSAALHLGDVRLTGLYYSSDRRGSLTVISEAAAGSGRPDGDAMDAATEVAVLFPPP
ncbi:MAG TPA: hypothetical protein VJ870_07220 [Amycolatopsis sp.]|nr:hypothetical protein [Amycolatopsis sp.]